jgi:hypothetical protein
MRSTLQAATVGLVEIPYEIPDVYSSFMLHVASIHDLLVK